MIYAFVQDGQSIEILRQQWESLSSYAQSRALTIDKWLDSTSFDPELFKAKDVLLLEKTFRLGKDIRTITAIMQDLLQKGVVICSCEDNITFGGDSASSKTMADMLGLVTDIVEELRSRLTKEALTSRKLDDYSGYLNLGTGVGTSVMEIIKAAEKVSGKTCPVTLAARREGDPAKLFADNKKAKRILNWNPVYTDIENIIKTAWFWETNRRF